jgi:hypothetical protein
MAEPIRSNNAAEPLRSFQVMEQKMTSRGSKPKFMTLDNEAPKLLKDYLHDQDTNFQLVPPYCHQRNAAEHTIRSFKDHLIAGLFSTDKAVPMHLYVGQTTTTSYSHTQHATHVKNKTKNICCNSFG